MDRKCGLPALSPHEAQVQRFPCQAMWEAGVGLCALPRHLWCWVAQYFDVGDSGATQLCSSWLLASFEVEALWHHHVVMKDFAKPASGPDFSWMYPFGPALQVERCIDWRRLLRLNMKGRRDNCAIWVRIIDLDVRVPIPPNSENEFQALTEELHSVVSIQTAKHRLPLEDELGMPVDLDCPTSPGGSPGEVWPMRLREMQWGGRPGPVLHEGSALAGSRVMLEIALPGSSGWPLPPRMIDSSAFRLPKSMQKRHLSSSSSSGLGHWLPAGAFCSATHLSYALASTPSAATHAPSEPSENTALLRIISLLMPRELWITLDLGMTLGGLFQELARTLRRESLLLADISRPIQFKLVDTSRQATAATLPETTPLREMFWARSETVHVEVESSTSKGMALSTARQAPTLGNKVEDASPGRRNALVLCVRREAAFMEAPALATDRAARQLMELPPSFGSGLGWCRQLSEPPFQDSWSRQASETPSDLFGPSMLRQASEPAPAAASRQAPVREEASHAQGLAAERSGSGRCSPVSERVLGLGHPGDTALDFPEEIMRQSGAAGTYTEEVVPSSSSRESAWERIVPHYPPRLLPRTLRTRQFEFHPTMPELMLVGDKKGSVNILDCESDEVHPSLAVGICPLLGLVWMKHHTQHAVCGTSHAGKIMFLKYDTNARITEPALSCTQTVEAFPKLSSLSANCTDDFLLASGISPNVAIYDIQTGKVLHRAHGVHEHFINISRFCHNSPHIFATASFDHTCKVWDLRQPLTHDRPLKTLNTGGHNVMCVFSPDDRRVLCSGVDTRLMQFEVPSWRQTPETFPLRSPVHRERYRRSTYLGDSWHFVTAATEESHMHLLSADGRKLGVVDFRGVVRHWSDKGKLQDPFRSQRAPRDPARDSPGNCLGQVPRLAGSLQAHIAGRRYGLSPWPFGHVGLHAPMARGVGGDWECHKVRGGQSVRPQLVQGAVQLDDADPNGGSTRKNHEFVQSIRTHPTIKTRVGVLLSLTQGEQSYVALVDLDPRAIEH